MISGFNTDVEFQGTVYHVQTEDKGLPTRTIVSLVYDKGTILASKRASYADLGDGNSNGKELAQRLSRQHKLICAAVKTGRIDDLRAMSAKTGTAAVKIKASAFAADVEAVAAPEPITTLPVFKVAAPVPVSKMGSVIPRPPINIAIVEAESVVEMFEPFEEELVLDAVHIIEDVEILPDDAVAVVSELSGRERSSNSKLSLELVGETKFKGGDRRTVNIMICRGTERKVVGDAQIMIKVLGSSFRPVIFHARSDANGIARVHLQLPHFEAGRAALLVRAITGGEEIELRRVVTAG